MDSAIDGPIEDSLTPLGDRLLVVLDEESEETESGIHLPDGVSEGRGDGAMGIVYAMGEGAIEDELAPEEQVLLGDRILFNENVGRDLPRNDDDKQYRLVRKANVLAVLGDLGV
jgi:co-chaperonin GroES (HSP10)